MSGLPELERILRLAEAPSLYDPVDPDERLVAGERYVLFLGRGDHAGFNTVQHLRLAGGGEDSVEQTVAEVRALARDHGRSALTWEVASTATPPGLLGRLRGLDMQPGEPPLAVAMALRQPPPAPPPELAVTRVTTVADFRTFVTITHEVFGRLEHLPAELERIDRAGARDLEHANFMRYIGWLDGAPAAAATATFTPDGAILHSGSTRPAARGRGLYRALVAARWADAVERGTPLAVTRAGPMSRPILRRVGFEELAEISFLIDRF